MPVPAAISVRIAVPNNPLFVESFFVGRIVKLTFGRTRDVRGVFPDCKIDFLAKEM